MIRIRNISSRLQPAFVAVCLLVLGGCKLTSDAPRPSILGIVSGDSQTAPAGTDFPSALGVIVLNQYDGPVQDITVTWAITAGGGSLSATSTMTDANGTAVVTYTAGPTPGAATVTATVVGIGTVAFKETIT